MNEPSYFSRICVLYSKYSLGKDRISQNIYICKISCKRLWHATKDLFFCDWMRSISFLPSFHSHPRWSSTSEAASEIRFMMLTLDYYVVFFFRNKPKSKILANTAAFFLSSFKAELTTDSVSICFLSVILWQDLIP